MRISGHSYNNNVFESLLDGLGDDVVLRKAASKTKAAPVTGMDIFSSTTEQTLNGIHEDELKQIAGELEFAADRAKVAVTSEDLVKFAHQVQKENIQGKALERAAQKYCNQVQREVAEPQCMTTRKTSLLDQLASHKIISATFDPDSVNDSKTGGFLGMSKNPNTIWDSDALTELAQTKTGDEKIKESKQAKEEFKQSQKQAFWQDLQEKHSDTEQVKKRIVNAGTSPETED